MTSSSTTTIAINGFGRIGRNVLRAIAEQGRSDLEVVAINDLYPTATNAHLLRYDSVHGPFRSEVTEGADWIDIGAGRIRVCAERDPAALPWSGVDVVLECTVVMKPRSIPTVSFRTFATGARQFVVQEALDTTR